MAEENTTTTPAAQEGGTAPAENTTPEPTIQEQMDQRLEEAAKLFEAAPESSETATEGEQQQTEGQAQEGAENTTEGEQGEQGEQGDQQTGETENKDPDERPVKQALREIELAKEKAALEIQLAQYQQLVERQQRLEVLKKQDPLAYLNETGLSLDQLTDHLINNGPKEPTVADLQRELAEYKQQQAQLIQEQQNEIIRQRYRNNINTFVKEKAEAFPVVSSLGLMDVVYDKIAESAETAKSDADLLSVEAAAKLVNQEFVDLYNQLHAVLGKAPAAAAATTPASTTSPPAAKAPAGTTTLTNAMDSLPAETLDTSGMTDAEIMEIRLKQAAKMFESGN